jgi:hypothetical protein
VTTDAKGPLKRALKPWIIGVTLIVTAFALLIAADAILLLVYLINHMEAS